MVLLMFCKNSVRSKFGILVPIGNIMTLLIELYRYMCIYFLLQRTIIGWRNAMVTEKNKKLLIGNFLLAVPKTCAVPQQLPSNSASGIVISNVDTFEFKRIHAGKNTEIMLLPSTR
jgi:hypothetical protein